MPAEYHRRQSFFAFEENNDNLFQHYYLLKKKGETVKWLTSIGHVFYIIPKKQPSDMT